MSAMCSKCQFWRNRPDKPLAGQCRGGLPQVLTLGHDSWPVTSHDAWCGHWRPREAVAPSGDTRPGAAMVRIEENGIVTVIHHDGEELELSAFNDLSEADIALLQRMVWTAGA